MKPEIHLKRARCPVNRTQTGWAWTVVATNRESARGWHSGSQVDARTKARDALKRLEALHDIGRRTGMRSAEAALVQGRTAA